MVARIDTAQLFRLDGRTAIVTGASSGLGSRFARVFDSAGANLVIAARRLDRLEALAKELRCALVVQCDVSLEAHRERLVEAALDRFGRVDVLVNNAGTGAAYPAESEPLDNFYRALEVNLVGAFHLAQLCGRGMLDQGSGSIINVGSAFGVVASGRIPNASYGSSKAALHQLSRELASQWGSRGVRVNALIPGWFPSELTNALLQSKSWLEWIRANTPVDRVGEEQELDGALLFLASDASTFMTGQLVVVDGGWSLGSPTATPGPLGQEAPDD